MFWIIDTYNMERLYHGKYRRLGWRDNVRKVCLGQSDIQKTLAITDKCLYSECVPQTKSRITIIKDNYQTYAATERKRQSHNTQTFVFK